ncbi:MAG: hypothetical protein ACXVUL_04020 [Solirubrobacteraceae bacterium]
MCSSPRTPALPLKDVLFLVPYPFIVWGADELRRWLIRRHEASNHPAASSAAASSPAASR